MYKRGYIHILEQLYRRKKLFIFIDNRYEHVPLFLKEGTGEIFVQMQKYRRDLKKFSRDFRKQMTGAELKLWSKIRRKQICGVQFYRQKPLLDYIVDFYAPAVELVIEVDGSQHFEQEHQQRDKLRDQKLGELGIRVLRFDNAQFLLELDAVVETIYDIVEKKVGLKLL